MVLTLGTAPTGAAEVAQSCGLTGHVADGGGGALKEATVTLLTSSSTIRAQTRTDATGAYAIPDLAPGTYVIETRAPRFAPAQQVIRLEQCPFVPMDVHLVVDGPREWVTVTPVPSESGAVAHAPQLITVTESSAAAVPFGALLPELLRGTAGVSIQTTSTSQASPFVRGLTGQHVVTLIDGVRFNTATFRPGANQYLAFIDTASVNRIDVVRGPGAVAYGSDALGGTINVLTHLTGWGRPTFGIDGSATVGLGSADQSAAGSFTSGGGGRQWGFFVDGALRSYGDLRAGGGIDSHSVATRLLGLSSRVLGSELAQTGYRQRSGSAKLDIRMRPSDSLGLQYMHGAQQGASRYDQLDGGAGNLLHRFDPQAVDFGIARYDRLGLGPFDTLSVRGSYNRQQDDRTTQSVNNSRQGLRSPIIAEQNTTTARGALLNVARSRHARHRVGAGLEIYDERVASTRLDHAFEASTGAFSAVTRARGRYPDGARYQTLGTFARYEWVPVLDRLTLAASARYSRFTYEQGTSALVRESPVVIPSYRNVLGDDTYQASAVWSVTRDVLVSAMVSRGFRAPNVNDRGTIGLSGNGFEVPPEEVVSLGARVVPFGAVVGDPTQPAQVLAPERLWNYELGVQYRRGPFTARGATFRADLYDLIERKVVVLPPGALGSRIGGEEVVRQDALGSVYTNLASTPVFVRTNAGHVLLQGVEGTVSVRLPRSLSAEANASYIRGEDVASGRPPGLENGIPPLHGGVFVRWQAPQRRWFSQASALFAARQGRLSANDIAQARIGGFRTASEITQFFNNGAVARGLVQGGVLVPTGETVSQVVTRVLGPSVATGAPMFTSNAGYVVVGLACGIRLGRQSTTMVAIDNLTDRNYRVMGSGVDGAGRNIRLVQTFVF